MNLNELAGYLKLSDPRTLEKLVSSFPSKEYEMIFGNEENDINCHRTATLAILKAVASQVVIDSNELARYMKGKIETVRKIRLIGALVTTASGSSSVIIEHFYSDKSSIIAALITTISGLITLFADHIEKTPTGAKFEGEKTLSEIVEIGVSAEKMLLKIDGDSMFRLANKEIKDLHEACIEAATTMKRFKYISINV